MTYCTSAEVYAAAGITSSEVATANVDEFILQAEARVDRFTNTTYWNLEDSGTASAGASTTLTDSSQSWSTDVYANMYVWIHTGTGSGQVRLISSNTATVLTVATAWDTNPSSDSEYRIIYTGTNPYVEAELRDGDGTDTLYTDKYPLVLLESVTSDSISVTPSKIYQYASRGKLVFKSDAEVSRWTYATPQANSLTYWYGVYPLPYEVKRLTLLYASIMTLESQMGGTHNIPSTVGLPEINLSVGQAYVNIEGTVRRLIDEKNMLEERIIKYASFA